MLGGRTSRPGSRRSRPRHRDSDRVTGGACSVHDCRNAGVERSLPELAEGEHQAGRGRDERSKTEWAHTGMLAAAPDAAGWCS